MGFTSFLSALFGNKSKRDLSKLMPIVEQIKAVEPSLLGISNDELRQKITEARTRIQESVADQRGRIAKLKEEIETLEYDKREPLWTEIDKLEKLSDSNTSAATAKKQNKIMRKSYKMLPKD